MTTGKLFGTDTVGSVDNGAPYIVMTRWQASASGIVSQVRLYSRVSGNVKVGIYADSSGEPGSLLASQQTSTAVTGGQWNTVNLSSNLSVTKDTYYWIAFNSSVAGANVAVSGTGYSRRYKSFTFSNNLPDPAGTGYTSESNQYYDSTAAYGILTILPSGIASAEAFGTPQLTLKIAPSGIASLEAFGSPTVTKGVSGQEIIPTGIPSAEAFGTPSLRYPQFISPTGIPSAQAFGTLTIGKIVIYPVGIGSTETFGTPAVVFTYLKSQRYQIEVHASNGNLIAILENAYNIAYTQEINVPHTLKFSLPATDDKRSNITLTNEYYLRDMSDFSVVRKFKLIRQLDRRESGGVYTEVECRDYLSQLSTAKITDYTGGIVMKKEDESGSRTGYAKGMCVDDDYIYVLETSVNAGTGTACIKKYTRSTLAYHSCSANIANFTNIQNAYDLEQDTSYLYFSGDNGTTGYLYKYAKSNLALSASVSLDAYDIVLSGSYIYTIYSTGVNSLYIAKHNTSDLAQVSYCTTVFATVMDIATDDTYIYVIASFPASATDFKIHKISISNMGYVAASGVISSGSPILYPRLKINNSRIYLFGQPEVPVYSTSLTLSKTITTPTNQVMSACFDNNYVYLNDGSIYRFLQSDLSYHDKSSAYASNSIYCMGITDDALNIYVVQGQYPIYHYSTCQTLALVIPALLAMPSQLPAVTTGDITDYASLIPDIRLKDTDVLGVLNWLRDTYGGYIEVDNDRKFNWQSTIGENKGQQIRYKKNLLGIEREIDYSTLFNRIYAYGYNYSTGARVKLSTSYTYDYVEDATSQSTWGGIYTAMFINYSMTDPATVKAWADSLLAKYKDPYISYRISAVDLSRQDGFSFDELLLGSTITIIDEILGINVSAQIVRIEHPNLSDPLNMTLDVSNVVRNIVNTISQLADKTNKQGYLIAA